MKHIFLGIAIVAASLAANAQLDSPKRFDHISVVGIDPAKTEGDSACLGLAKNIKGPVILSGKQWVCAINPSQATKAPAYCQIQMPMGGTFTMSGESDLQTGSFMLNSRDMGFSKKDDPQQSRVQVHFQSGSISEPAGIYEIRIYDKSVWKNELNIMRKAPADITYQCRLIWSLTNSFQ